MPFGERIVDLPEEEDRGRVPSGPGEREQRQQKALGKRGSVSACHDRPSALRAVVVEGQMERCHPFGAVQDARREFRVFAFQPWDEPEAMRFEEAAAADRHLGHGICTRGLRVCREDIALHVSSKILNGLVEVRCHFYFALKCAIHGNSARLGQRAPDIGRCFPVCDKH